MKYIYNFNGFIYETSKAFDNTYYRLKAECVANGERITRQVVKGNTITNECYSNGIWLAE